MLVLTNEYPHVEKIKNLREQNFKGEASNPTSNKQLDSDNTHHKATSKLNSCVKYLDSFICFC